MFENRILARGLAALGLLFLGCSHAQQTKPTEPPVSKAPSAPPSTAPTPLVGETPPPASVAKAPLDPIHFDFDKYDIHAEDRQSLEALGAYLESGLDRALTISGHCDERGTVEYNIALGDRRARAARDFLVRLGVDPGRIKTVSYGEEKPVDLGHNEEAWAKNRRAEFQIELKQRAQR